MKPPKDIHKNSGTPVTVNPSLAKLEEKILFPEKLAKAKEQLKDAKLPFKKPAGN